MAIITVIGCGMMGTGICRPAGDNGHIIRLVGTPLDREIVEYIQKEHRHIKLKRDLPGDFQAFQFEDVKEALQGADLVVGGVSSFGVDWFTENALPVLESGTLLLNITKGLMPQGNGKLITFPDYYNTIRPDITCAAVGGPCTSYELFDRNQTIVNFCCRNKARAEEASKYFANSYYHVIPTDDVVGVETGVAMKNAFAVGVCLAVGMAERRAGVTDARLADPGMQNAAAFRSEYNPQAALFAESCLEMSRIIAVMGGNPLTAAGIPGAGDLFVTVFGGRTRLLGTLLGRGLPYTEVKQVLKGVTLEAVNIIERMANSLRQRFADGEAEADPQRFPLLMHLDGILFRGEKADLPWDRFGTML